MIASIDNKRLFFLGLLTCCLIVWGEVVCGQSKVRTGKVISVTDQNPLAQVTVLNLSTQLAGRTDREGNFSINAAEGDKLRFSLVRYKTAELLVSKSAALGPGACTGKRV